MYDAEFMSNFGCEDSLWLYLTLHSLDGNAGSTVRFLRCLVHRYQSLSVHVCSNTRAVPMYYSNILILGHVILI